MYKKVVCLLIITLVQTNLQAQKKSNLVFLNHIYFVLDSNTYAHIFDSAFLQQIGNTKAASVTTTDESWSGKYFYGRDSYFELFSPTGFEGAAIGDVGFGFMTFKQGDIWEVKKNWKDNSKDSVITDTSTYVSDGKRQEWYYSLNLSAVDSLLSVSAWVMENTPGILKAAGFSDEEIKKPISWQEYVEKKYKTNFTKAFNRITSVELITNKDEYDYLKKSFSGFGLLKKNHRFYNDFVTIKCTIENVASTKLKTVVIELNEGFPERTIIMSTHLTMHVKDKSASLIFNY